MSLSASNIVVACDGTVVLDNISLDVADGECLALAGVERMVAAEAS